MQQRRVLFLMAVLCCCLSCGKSAQRAADDESNPLLDIASMFIQETLNNQNNGNGGAAGLSGVASLIGSFMQAQGNGGAAKSASGAMQILSGLGSLMTNAGNNKSGGGSGGFDPSIIGNVLEMFTNNDDSEADTETSAGRSNNRKQPADTGLNMDAILQLASVFMKNNNNNNNNNRNEQKASQNAHQQQHHHQAKRSSGNDVNRQTENEDGLMSLLPLVLQAVSSFAGPEGQHTQEKHKDHAWVLPPFLEHIHVLWDHFSNSELADALYEKSGVNKILRGFKSRDGKLDYDKLFDSLNNQSFRRRWIKAATLYLADWASYLANPDVYLKYFQTTELMFNGFLKSQGYPKNTLFDASKPSETLSNLLDHVAKNHLNVKIDSRQYVKPAVGYAKELLKLGQARGLLKFNATDLSDKLTDTLNLEVIEPVLKVHRAYRFIKKTPHCDRYVLCSLNSGDATSMPDEWQQQQQQQERGGVLANVSSRIVRIGSMGAAIFISTETGTPFWTLFGVINSPNNCEVKYPVDCSGFHVGEAKVTTEYIHNEL